MFHIVTRPFRVLADRRGIKDHWLSYRDECTVAKFTDKVISGRMTEEQALAQATAIITKRHQKGN